jgi:RNA polymerase sigma-70 factor (ECF subfamily)
MAVSNKKSIALLPAQGGALWNVKTPWTVLLQADAAHAANLERLLSIYREPVYAYYRAQQLSESDAEDLTQQLLMDFFLVRGSHKKAQAARGRFRFFLLSSARHALLDWKKHKRSLKRGGKAAHVSLEQVKSTKAAGAEHNDPADPDALFDRHWALATWRAGFESFKTQSSAQLVEAFELFYAAQQGNSQELAAKKLGISTAAFNSRLFTARQKFFECIKDIVQTTLEDKGEMKEELDYLFRLLSEHGFT